MQVDTPWALIPAHDEAPRIEAVLRALDVPALVVDDRSSDGTAAVAQSAGATVIASQEAGYAGTIRTGHRWFLEQGIHRVIQLDADGQHPPAAVNRLLDALDDANWVIGSRQGTDSPTSLGRRAGNRLLGLGVRALTGACLHDVTSGFWALDARALRLFAAFTADVADANVRVAALKAGLRVHELPVAMPDRDSGASMHDGWRGVRNLSRSVSAMWAAR